MRVRDAGWMVRFNIPTGEKAAAVIYDEMSHISITSMSTCPDDFTTWRLMHGPAKQAFAG